MSSTEIGIFLQNSAQVIMPLVQLLTGCLLSSIFLRRDTSTEEFEKVKAGKFSEAIGDLLKSGKMTYTEYYKTNNFLSVAKIADEKHCKGLMYDESKNYDFDWLIRFYETVGNISDKNMQEIWAKILAQEVQKPNSVSLKVIDVLKNIRKSDAELFEKICKYSFKKGGDVFLPNNEKYMDKYKIEYNDILLLSEHDLIYNDGMLCLKYNLDKNYHIICYNNEEVMVAKTQEETKKEYNLSCFPFTTTGSSIFTIVNKIASTDEICQYANFLCEDNKYIFEVRKILSFHDKSITYGINNILK